MRFGGRTPELTKFAIRVLSLTCSSSGCERNWSTFESIHTKKRNRLEHCRINALVYVRYNTRLREWSIKRKMHKIDPILVDEVDSDDEWITEREDPVLPEEPSWLDEENLFDVDVIKMVSCTPYEDELINDTTIDVGSTQNTSESGPFNKKQKVAEISDLQRGNSSSQVQIDEGLQDVDIVDEARWTNTNTLNLNDDELHFDSD
ncbi:uncharacterized protein LOC132047945 isoform X1 [Lycium ferocissimum]|uniref:uncharacterized protein LOC132047945 isoform X1 n=1 Tax=Lycium ferocissimum TaxID=112874 RepID=UPI00281528C7|nr:uncharacterized protein LOC132047945 isoform X1 [Lycium ferocissimum]